MDDGSWQPDPTGRHQYRWWGGTAWSDHVADNGVRTVDPVGAAPQRVATALAPAPTPVDLAEDAEGPAPERVVRTFDPAGAVLAALPRPKPRKPILRWLLIGTCAVAVGVVGVVMAKKQYDEWRAQHGPSVATKGKIDQPGGYLTRTVKLRAGQAARVRVETGKNIQVDVWVVTDDGSAEQEAEAWADSYPETVQDQVPDPNAAAIMDELFTDAPTVLFTDGGTPAVDTGGDTPFAGYTAVRHLCCQEARLVTGTWVSFARTTYKVVVVARSGSGNVRIVVEPLAEPRLEPGGTYADLYSDSDFFSDPAFFDDAEEYTPAS